MKKTECPVCGKLISNNNLEKHIKSHETHPKYQAQQSGEIQVYHLDHTDLFCKFCGKKCKNKNSLVQHEIRCSQNPQKLNTTIDNFNKKGRVYKNGKSAWNKGLTKETDERVAKYSELISTSVSKFFEQHPEKINGGYKPGAIKKGFKYGTYKGFYCDSSWELAFVIYCLDHNIEFNRNKIGFDYLLNNRIRKFYPDFIIGDTYYEVKGGYDKNVNAKLVNFPHKIILIDQEKIKPYLRYTKEKYGKDFIRLYDRNHPSWMDKENI